ncbi:MAG: DUF4215 domain-containing protein [bacterium]
MGRLLAVMLVVAGAGGCLAPESRFCSSDLVCPAGKVCDDTHGQCVFPAQLTACGGLAEGDYCSFAGSAAGTHRCQDGVCLTFSRCGDGVIGEGEDCDCGTVADVVLPGCDGANSDSLPDRCRTDCSLPTCGDGVRDTDEECDDGNELSADGCSELWR